MGAYYELQVAGQHFFSLIAAGCMLNGYHDLLHTTSWVDVGITCREGRKLGALFRKKILKYLKQIMKSA